MVEFLVAITLGALVLTGLVTVFMGNKTSYNVQEGLARLQENGRYSTYYMNRILRMAGYQGCVNTNNLNLTNIVKNPSSAAQFDNPVFGYEGSSGTWSPALPANLAAANVKPGTDVIEVRFATDLGIRLSNNMANPNAALVLADPDGDGDEREGIKQDDVFIITDCEIGDIAAAGGNENAASISVAASNNTTVTLSKAYTTRAKILRYDYFVFYIKNTGRTNLVGDPIYALVAQDISGNEFELADGVDDLQITYGVDTNNDGSANSYMTADAVNGGNNWDNVLSMQVKKLMTTVESVNTVSQTYTFDGTTTTPADRVLRREWSNHVSIRNRSFP